MKAMVLAAGLGTRLRPLTNDRPKALVEVAGRPLLEITLRRLREFGIRDVIINVHHFADMISDYLQRYGNFGMHIELSREEALLDTGGGLKRASWFFLEPSGENEPFLLHNVDVLSAINFERILKFHRDQNALATLAVQRRDTSRPLLFDEDDQLCGRRTGAKQHPEMARSAASTQAFAFCGIHVISPRVLSMLTEEGAFSIIPAYLRLAAQGEKICAFHADDYYWRDLGKAENIESAERDAEALLFRI
jgi:NDP-sugar pyrophosphorylase family protein